MRRTRHLILHVVLWFVVVVAGALALSFGRALAQEKQVTWERFDVDIVVHPDGSFTVTERNLILFEGGTFRRGWREVPTSRLEDIADVSVSFDGQPLVEADSEEPGTFSWYVDDEDDVFFVRYYFPKPVSGRHEAVLRYRVIGGLRYYDEGDQLWWKAVYPDRAGTVQASRVTVTLPEGAPAQQVADYGADATWQVEQDGRRVVFTAEGPIPPDEELEVRVQFPHGVVAGSAPAWQLREDRLRRVGTQLNVASLFLALLVGGGLVTFAVLKWYISGRDAPVPLAAEYLSEPPDDLPPAMAGTLLDEVVTRDMLVATLIDLGQRGAIRIEEVVKAGSAGPEYRLALVDESKVRHPFEQRLLEAIFGPPGRRWPERYLSEVRETLHEYVDEIENALYDGVVEQGFFEERPDKVRSRWMRGGVLVIALGVIGLIGGFFALADLPVTPIFMVLPVSIILGGIALLVAGMNMPRKTRKGSEVAAKWAAFKRYLADLKLFDDERAAAERWSAYLPYAVAFDVADQMLDRVGKLSAALLPGWYRPAKGAGEEDDYEYDEADVFEHTEHARHHQISRERETSGLEPSGRETSLQEVSQRFSRNIQGLSTSLAVMLQETTLTFIAPSSGSSSSGGGWSGGGSSGGGGGGGGGGGFD